MAIKRERQRYTSQPIGVVKYSDAIASSHDSIANSFGNISNTFFKQAASLAPTIGDEAARAVTEANLKSYDPETGEPTAWKVPDSFGTIKADAYKRRIRLRWEQSINNEMKNVAGKLYTQYKDSPNALANFDGAFAHHLGEMHKHAQGEWKEYIETTGNQLRLGSGLKISEYVSEIERQKNAQSLEIELTDRANVASTLLNEDELNAHMLGSQSLIADAENTDSTINGPVLTERQNRQERVNFWTSQINSAYRESKDNTKLQGDINRIIWTGGKSGEALLESLNKNNEISPSLYKSLKSILKIKNLSDVEKRNLTAQISTASTDMNRFTDEEQVNARLFMDRRDDFFASLFDGDDITEISDHLQNRLYEGWEKDYTEIVLSLGGDPSVVAGRIKNFELIGADNSAVQFIRNLESNNVQAIDKVKDFMIGTITSDELDAYSSKTNLLTATEVDVAKKVKKLLSEPAQNQFAQTLKNWISDEGRDTGSSLTPTEQEAFTDIFSGNINAEDSTQQKVAASIYQNLTLSLDSDPVSDNPSLNLRNKILTGEIFEPDYWDKFTKITDTGLIPKEAYDVWDNIYNGTITGEGEILNGLTLYSRLSTSKDVDGTIINRVGEVFKDAKSKPEFIAFLDSLRFIYDAEEGNIADIVKEMTFMRGDEYIATLAGQINYDGIPKDLKSVNDKLASDVETWFKDKYNDRPDSRLYNYSVAYAKYLLNHSNNEGVKPQSLESVLPHLDRHLDSIYHPNFSAVFLQEQGTGKWTNMWNMNLLAKFGSKSMVHNFLDKVELEVQTMYPHLKNVRFDRSDEPIPSIVDRAVGMGGDYAVLDYLRDRATDEDDDYWGWDYLFQDPVSMLKGMGTGFIDSVKKFHDIFTEEGEDWYTEDVNWGTLKLKPYSTGEYNGFVQVVLVPPNGVNGVKIKELYRVSRNNDGQVRSLLDYNLDAVENKFKYNQMDDSLFMESLSTGMLLSTPRLPLINYGNY